MSDPLEDFLRSAYSDATAHVTRDDAITERAIRIARGRRLRRRVLVVVAAVAALIAAFLLLRPALPTNSAVAPTPTQPAPWASPTDIPSPGASDSPTPSPTSVPTPSAAASTLTRTQTVTLAPVVGGQINPAFAVVDQSAVLSCSVGSPYVDSSLAFWCGGSADRGEACVADPQRPGSVLCVSSSAQTSLRRYRRVFSGVSDASGEKDPVSVQLENGLIFDSGRAAPPRAPTPATATPTGTGTRAPPTAGWWRRTTARTSSGPSIAPATSGRPGSGEPSRTPPPPRRRRPPGWRRRGWCRAPSPPP